MEEVPNQTWCHKSKERTFLKQKQKWFHSKSQGKGRDQSLSSLMTWRMTRRWTGIGQLIPNGKAIWVISEMGPTSPASTTSREHLGEKFGMWPHNPRDSTFPSCPCHCQEGPRAHGPGHQHKQVTLSSWPWWNSLPLPHPRLCCCHLQSYPRTSNPRRTLLETPSDTPGRKERGKKDWLE